MRGKEGHIRNLERNSMPFLQFALLTLDGTVYSKPMQFTKR